MRALPLSNETRNLGAPTDWDAEKRGPCGSLSIHDRATPGGGNEMVSAWALEPGEAQRLAKGAPVFLTIAGTVHPPVGLFVHDEAVADPVFAVATGIANMLSALIVARLEAEAKLRPSNILLVSPPIVDAGQARIEFVSCSVLEIIPPDLARWSRFGPFKVAEASA